MDKYAKESQFSVIPVTKKERTLGILDSSLVNCGWGIATWCFLTGGTLATLVDFKTAFVIALVGNTLGVTLAALASSLPSNKYGIDTYTSMISFLGKNGMKIVFAFFLATNVGWVTVLSSMCARSAQNIYEYAKGAVAPDWTFPAITIVAALLTWLIVVKGPSALKMMNRIMVPGLIIVMMIMIVAMVTNFSMSDVLKAEPLEPYPSKALNIWFAFELSVGAGLSWWPGLGALARLNKNAKTTYWGNVIGLSFACVAMCSIAVAAAFAIGGSDPTTWMIPLGGIVLGGLALFFIALANLTSNSYVMYNTCLGLKNYGFFLNKSWFFVTASFMVPVIVLSFFPDFVYGNYQMLLNFCVALFGPLSVLQLLDYMVFRKQYIDLRSLYNHRSDSDLYYKGGVNWGAVIIFIASVAVYCIILNPVTWGYNPIFEYVSASIPSILFCFVAYYIYGKAVIIPKNMGNVNFYKDIKS